MTTTDRLNEAMSHVTDEPFPLDTSGRAAVLGISFRALVDLQRSDPRIMQAVAKPGMVHRLKRWIRAGQPAADITRTIYRGSDSVRAILYRVLAAVPRPVAWHASEFIVFREVGANARGRCASRLRGRDPDDGDEGHEIDISGRERADDLPAILAHEVAHS